MRKLQYLCTKNADFTHKNKTNLPVLANIFMVELQRNIIRNYLMIFRYGRDM